MVLVLETWLTWGPTQQLAPILRIDMDEGEFSKRETAVIDESWWDLWD